MFIDWVEIMSVVKNYILVVYIINKGYYILLIFDEFFI